MSDKTFLVAGLGNIGPEYAGTRHNIGFMVLDAWARASNAVFHTERYGDVAELSVKGRTFVLLKPSTYMNLSGNAVRYWVQKLDIPLENLMVVCDDLNLPFGTLRLRPKGSDGGHNGLKNIQELLGTQDWARLRVGVGHDFAQGRQIDFVLGSFTPEQQPELEKIEARVIAGLKDWAFVGVSRAMNSVNAKPAASAPDKASAPAEIPEI